MTDIEYQSCYDLQVEGQPETYCCAGCGADAEYGYDAFSEHYLADENVPWTEQRVIARSCCRHHEAMHAHLRTLGAVES